jgi:hypothetical protein
MSRLLGDRIEAIVYLQFRAAIDFAVIIVINRRRCDGCRNDLSSRTVEVAVERSLIEIAILVLLLIQRVTFVCRARTRRIAHDVDAVEVVLAVFGRKLHAFLVNIVMAIVALHSLLEQPPQELFTILANGRPRVGVDLKGMRNLYSLICYRPGAAAIRGRAVCARIRNLLQGKDFLRYGKD